MKTIRNLLPFASLSLLALVGSADTALAQCTTPICASPTTLTFTSATPSQPIALTTNGGPVSYGISISPSDWLQVDQPIGVAPATAPASVKPTVAIGAYAATITITPNSGSPVMISATANLSGTGGSSAL